MPNIWGDFSPACRVFYEKKRAATESGGFWDPLRVLQNRPVRSPCDHGVDVFRAVHGNHDLSGALTLDRTSPAQTELSAHLCADGVGPAFVYFSERISHRRVI